MQNFKQRSVTEAAISGKRDSTQVFCCKISEIFKKTYCEERLRTVASNVNMEQFFRPH